MLQAKLPIVEIVLFQNYVNVVNMVIIWFYGDKLLKYIFMIIYYYSRNSHTIIVGL